MKLYVILFLIVTVAAIGFSAQEKMLMAQIDVNGLSPHQLDKIRTLNLDITFADAESGMVEAILRESQKNLLESLGFSVSPVIDDLATYAAKLRDENYFQRFHTVEQLYDRMQSIVDAYPEIAALHDIGDSYKKTVGKGGYDIFAIKISDQVSIEESNEADVLYVANIHAREIITPQVLLYFLNHLVENYGTDPYTTHLVNNREIWIILTMNPDGHHYVFTGDVDARYTSPGNGDPIWWRKNMRDNNGNGTFDFDQDGVDLNRNFGFMWGIDDEGSSSVPGEVTYRGPAPFSEPEAQAIRDFVKQHDFVASLFYHSYSDLWLFPWGYKDSLPPEPDASSFQAIADSCTAYNGYRAGISTEFLYKVNGDTDDWLYGEMGIFAFSPEVGTIREGAFWPDTSFIQPQIEENFSANMYFAYAAGEEPIVKHQRLENYNTPQDAYVVEVTIQMPIPLTRSVPMESDSFSVYFRPRTEKNYTRVPLKADPGTGIFTAKLPGDQISGTTYYYISAKDSLGRTGHSPRSAPFAVDSFHVAPATFIATPTEQHPNAFQLRQNYPNPFNSRTVIEFQLPDESNVQLRVYDMLGKHIATLADNRYEAGTHRVSWDGKDINRMNVATGLYYYRLSTDDQSLSRKIVLIR